MKKYTLRFGLVAFALAISGSIYSQLYAPDQTGYEFVQNESPEPDECINRGMVCARNGTMLCTYTNAIGEIIVLRGLNASVIQCGSPLYQELW